MSNKFKYVRQVAIDFDGTIVRHRYPEIGESIPMAIESIRLMKDLGMSIFLNTMRSGESLARAIDYLKQHEITLDGYNENPTQRIWTNSPKVHADIFIDDRGYGAPILYDSEGEMFDWSDIFKDLKQMKKERG